jgi:rare lipoprotein A
MKPEHPQRPALARLLGAALVCSVLLGGCAARALPPTDMTPTADTSPVTTEMAALSTAPEDLPEEIIAESYTGLASWYGEDFDGRPTASGDIFDMAALTAAHQSLPFGSRVRVTNLANGRSVVVTINDRGPFTKQRLIDLSHGAAKKLGYVEHGVTKVRIDVLRDPAG